MVQCINCKNIKSHTKMTPLGFAHCKKKPDPSGFYSVSYERECLMFEQEKKDNILFRNQYFDKLRGKK